MFWLLVEQLNDELNNIKTIVSASDRMRTLIFSRVGTIPSLTAQPSEDEQLTELAQIRAELPRRAAWSLYEHCAALTRIYAVFESFVDALAKEYLDHLSGVYSDYAELPPAVSKQHRIGVAALLSKFGEGGMHSHISELKMLDGLSQGLTGRPYKLLGDAYLLDPQNYRPERIRKLFATLGLADVWSGIEKHDAVRDFLKTRDPNDTASTLLIRLVQERNLAAHSVEGQIFAAEELISFAIFLEALGKALSEITRKSLARLQVQKGLRLKYGFIKHRYSNQIVGIEFQSGTLREGDRVLLMRRTGAVEAKILSLRKVATTLQVAAEEHYGELGLRLDCDADEGAELFSRDMLELRESEAVIVPDLSETAPLAVAQEEDDSTDLAEPEEVGALDGI